MCGFDQTHICFWTKCYKMWKIWAINHFMFRTCGHLLGKGWPLGSRWWCLIVKLAISHWYPGSCVVLDCILSWFGLFLTLFWPFQGGASFVDHLCYLCFMFVLFVRSCLFLAALWSHSGKGLISWLSCVLCFLVFFTLSQSVPQVGCGI